jgi:hypothetical protein
MAQLPDGHWAYLTDPIWIPIERDDQWFEAFLRRVADLLVGDYPDADPDCPFCAWHEAA